MSRAVTAAWLVGAAVLSALAGYWVRHHSRPLSEAIPLGAQSPLDGTGTLALGSKRPDFTLNDLDGKPRQASEWDGQVMVVNFWATWCSPCRKEIPAFVQLQEEYGARGLQFVGIAIDDIEAVRTYVRDAGVNYPILVGASDAIAVAQAFGNTIGALPYTAVVNRDGRVVFAQPGEVSPEQAEAAISASL